MTDFSHLSDKDITDKTAEFSLWQLDGDPEPVLVMKSAGTDNKTYTSAVLKKTDRNRLRRIENKGVTTELLELARKQDRELFPQHVIVGWKNVKDAHGKDVKFTVDSCRDFLNALPDFLLDEVRKFANTPANFLGEDDGSGGEETAKN